MWSDGRDIFEGGRGGGSKVQKSVYSGLPFVQTKEERIFKRERNTIACLYSLSRKTIKLLSDLGERKLVPVHPFLSF